MNTITYKTLKLYAAIPQTRENIPAAWYEANEVTLEDFNYSYKPLLTDRTANDSFLATPADERRLAYNQPIQEFIVGFEWNLN